MQLTSVLFPEPFGPISPRRSPLATESSMPSSATNSAEAFADFFDAEQRVGHHGTFRGNQPCTRPTIPFGAITTKATRTSPTISRFTADEIVTVVTC